LEVLKRKAELITISGMKRKLKVFVKSILLFKNWWMLILARFNLRKKEFILRFRNGLSMVVPAPVNCVMGIYEVFGDKVYSKYCENPKIVVDIGGGLGDFSIYCAKRGAKVYMFEMNPNRSEIAEKNISINGIRNVSIFTQKVEKVPPIDCDLLKLDCEGDEYRIILDSPDEVFNGIKNIAMEYHGRGADIIRDRLLKLGYEVFVEPFKSKTSGYLYATKKQ
jgi:hypothetical protein